MTVALLVHIFFFQWLQPLHAAIAVALLVWLAVAGRTVQVVGPLLRRNQDTTGDPHLMTWIRDLRAALTRDAPAFNPSTQKPVVPCTVDASCEPGHHTYTWPCDYAPGTGRLAGEPEEGTR